MIKSQKKFILLDKIEGVGGYNVQILIEILIYFFSIFYKKNFIIFHIIRECHIKLLIFIYFKFFHNRFIVFIKIF